MANTKKALANNPIVDLTALSTEVFVDYQKSEIQASSVKQQAASIKPQAASIKHQASQASSQLHKVSR